MAVFEWIRAQMLRKPSDISWSLVGQGFEKVRRTARTNADSEWAWVSARYDFVSELNSGHKDKIRLRVGITATRLAIHQQTNSELLYGVFLGGIFGSLVFSAVFATIVSTLREQQTRTLALWVSIAALDGILLVLFIPLVVLARTVDRRYYHLDLEASANRRQARLVLCTVEVVCLFVIAFPGALKFSYLLAGTCALFIGMTPIVMVLDRIRYRSHRRRSPAPSYLDVAMIRLFDIACWTEWCRANRRWHQRTYISRLVAELEQAASDAERYGVQRVHWWNIAARREARKAGMRIAAVIRMHRAPLVSAVSPDDLRKVVVSLMAGVEAWSTGNSGELIRNAPEIAFRDWVRPIVGRLWPATVLIGSGIVLPMLSVFKNSPAAAQSMRVTLLVAGAIAMVGGGVAVSDRVNAAMDKAFSYGRKGDH